jgi:hypothetical protein
MRYICYISKDRVDSLYEEAFDAIVDETIERNTREKSRRGGFGVLQVLKASISFGRKEATSAEKRKRVTAVSRLKSVVEYLESTVTIGDLASMIEKKGKLDLEWYTITAEFSIPEWQQESLEVDLVANVDDYQLQLLCSKANFSGLHKEGEKYIASSTNRLLFEGKVKLPMSGLVRLAGVKKEQRLIICAPLYLVLNPLNVNLGELNGVEV